MTRITSSRPATTRRISLRESGFINSPDGQRDIGVVAEDVAQVVPELIARDPDTHEVQGVDYSRFAALLIEAVKSQQAEIEELERKSTNSGRIRQGNNPNRLGLRIVRGSQGNCRWESPMIGLFRSQKGSYHNKTPLT